MLLIINAIGIPGRLMPAYVADRYIGAVYTFIPIVFASAVCVFAWAGVGSLGGDYAWLLVYGFFGAAIGEFLGRTAPGAKDVLGDEAWRVAINEHVAVERAAKLRRGRLVREILFVAHFGAVGAGGVSELRVVG